METFWPTFFGAALGVAAGALIQYFSNILTLRTNRKKLYKAYAGELRFNLRVAKNVINEIQTYKTYSSTSSLHGYNGYIQYGRGVFDMLHQMVGSGLIYETLENIDIDRILDMTRVLSANNEKYINNKLDDFKTDSLIEDLDVNENNNFITLIDQEISKTIDDIEHLIKLIEKRK